VTIGDAYKDKMLTVSNVK